MPARRHQDRPGRLRPSRGAPSQQRGHPLEVQRDRAVLGTLSAVMRQHTAGRGHDAAPRPPAPAPLLDQRRTQAPRRRTSAPHRVARFRRSGGGTTRRCRGRGAAVKPAADSAAEMIWSTSATASGSPRTSTRTVRPPGRFPDRLSATGPASHHAAEAGSRSGGRQFPVCRSRRSAEADRPIGVSIVRVNLGACETAAAFVRLPAHLAARRWVGRLGGSFGRLAVA